MTDEQSQKIADLITDISVARDMQNNAIRNGNMDSLDIWRRDERRARDTLAEMGIPVVR